MRKIILFVVIGFVFVLTGCSSKYERHCKSGVVDYLYPNIQKGEVHLKPSIKELNTPTKLGIALVPLGGYYYKKVVTQSHRVQLLKRVKESLKNYKFIKKIELIPSAFLNQKGGFKNLKQIKEMYDIDTIMLLSHNQSQSTNDATTTTTYWSVIGAYIVPKNPNEIHTMIDATFYNIESEKFIFRASGVSRVKKQKVEGYELASEELIHNLNLQLTVIKDRVEK